jgi:hypothetical protein
MHSSSLDLLEKSNLPADQARAILQAVDSELALRNFATKDDLKSEVQVAKAELRTEIQTLRAEMLERFGRLEARIETMGTSWIRWSFVFWISGIGILFSLFKWLK